MGRIVGAFAMGHGPNLITTWERAGKQVCDDVLAGFAEVARRIKAVDATTLITISNDHFNNLFLNNLPAYCIGVADSYAGPEDDLHAGHNTINGNASLASHIVEHLYRHESFDPAVSHYLKLDHGTFVPVSFTFPAFDLPLIPILQNCVQPPLPTRRRAVQLGEALRRAVQSFPGDERVVVVGAGGISHFIGVPNQGYIDEAFDRRILAMLEAGDLDALINLSDEEVAAAGNGAEEIRNWMAAMSVAEGHNAETIVYHCVPAWLIGMGIVDFHYQSA